MNFSAASYGDEADATLEESLEVAWSVKSDEFVDSLLSGFEDLVVTLGEDFRDSARSEIRSTILPSASWNAVGTKFIETVERNCQPAEIDEILNRIAAGRNQSSISMKEFERYPYCFYDAILGAESLALAKVTARGEEIVEILEKYAAQSQ